MTYGRLLCLVCLREGHVSASCPQPKRDAHSLLDSARDGHDVPRAAITEALRVLGDVDDNEPLQIRSGVGTWERKAVLRLLLPAGPFDGLMC